MPAQQSDPLLPPHHRLRSPSWCAQRGLVGMGWQTFTKATGRRSLMAPGRSGVGEARMSNGQCSCGRQGHLLPHPRQRTRAHPHQQRSHLHGHQTVIHRPREPGSWLNPLPTGTGQGAKRACSTPGGHRHALQPPADMQWFPEHLWKERLGVDCEEPGDLLLKSDSWGPELTYGALYRWVVWSLEPLCRSPGPDR